MWQRDEDCDKKGLESNSACWHEILNGVWGVALQWVN